MLLNPKTYRIVEFRLYRLALMKHSENSKDVDIDIY